MTDPTILCPVHGISDCSPLLNGCSRVIALHAARDRAPAHATNRDTAHVSPEWSDLVGATAVLGQAVARYDAARTAYAQKYPTGPIMARDFLIARDGRVWLRRTNLVGSIEREGNVYVVRCVENDLVSERKLRRDALLDLIEHWKDYL